MTPRRAVSFPRAARLRAMYRQSKLFIGVTHLGTLSPRRRLARNH